MSKTFLIDLLQNIAILLAFSLLYDYFSMKKVRDKTLLIKFLTGVTIGAIGLILIQTPWILSPGLVFDTRSIMLSISGLFFGAIPTIIAILITGLYRFVMGGDGVWMGVAVIVSSGTIGILWGKLRFETLRENKYWELLFLGLLVHIVMLACTLLLPPENIIPTLKTIVFPVIIIYPLGTLILGTIMIRQYQNQKTREALRESERRWQFALEGNQDGVWDWNLTTNQVYYSKQYKAMLGYEEHEFESTIDGWSKRVHPDDIETCYSDIQKHLDGKEHFYSNVHRVLCKNGEYIWVLDRGKITDYSESGKPLRMVGTHTDLTERITKENELKLAKEKAEQSDRLKSAFLANMSHEIRTPMNGILGFAELLKEPDLTGEEQQAYIQIIEKSGVRMLNIINDIIDISKIEAGLMKLDVKDSNINDQIEYIYTFFKPEVEGKGLKFSSNSPLPDEEAVIRTDREKVYAILTNLVKNAIKYTDKGSIEFGYVLKTDREQQLLEFYVKDTGLGIPKDRIEAIFERFIQADITDEMVRQGAGLGLSISKAYVEMLGGKIWVESKEGSGSTFYFTLPYHESDTSFS
ncbi:MAG: LytS/YhcK type 5TM receptor domain-containing protein [Bacteroidales bacterium]|nr:LytS/YhcK type 5TM receptor domain-containing protein [Bacteroidales bacterium]